jgi:transposase
MTSERITGEFVLRQIEKLVDVISKPTVIVLDNAPSNRNRKMQERIPYWEARGLYIFYSPHLNIIEILWRKLKYEWLSAADYLNWENLKYQVRLGLSNVGSLLKINFSNFNHSLI